MTDATGEEQADGSIVIIPTQGAGGYAYEWTDMELAMDSISNLLPGNYSVVVTDTLLGCQDSITATVGILSTALPELSIVESLTIYPNPTAHSAQIDLNLHTPASVTIHVYNMVGQPISIFEIPTASTIHQDLELGDLPKGMYWVRIGVGEQFVSRKVFKVN